jgi:hypothetical protein
LFQKSETEVACLNDVRLPFLWLMLSSTNGLICCFTGEVVVAQNQTKLTGSSVETPLFPESKNDGQLADIWNTSCCKFNVQCTYHLCWLIFIFLHLIF